VVNNVDLNIASKSLSMTDAGRELQHDGAALVKASLLNESF